MARYKITVDFSDAGVDPNERQVEVATVLGKVCLDHLPEDFLRTDDGKSITAIVNAGTRRHEVGFEEVYVKCVTLEPPVGSSLANLEQAIKEVKKELPEARIIDRRSEENIEDGYASGDLVSTIDVRDMSRVVITRHVGTRRIGFCIRSHPSHQLYNVGQGLINIPVTELVHEKPELKHKAVLERYVILGEKARYERGERYCEPSELRWVLKTLDESISQIGTGGCGKPLVTYTKGKLTTIDIFPPKGEYITQLSWSKYARLLKQQQKGMIKYHYGPHLINIHRTNAYTATNGQRFDIRGMLVLKGGKWDIMPASTADIETIEERLDETPVQITTNDGSEALVLYEKRRVLIIPRTGSELEFKISESAIRDKAICEKSHTSNTRLKSYSVRDAERNEVYELGIARTTSKVLQQIELGSGIVPGDVFDKFYDAYAQALNEKK